MAAASLIMSTAGQARHTLQTHPISPRRGKELVSMQIACERLALKPEQLRHRLDPLALPFQTTAEVAPLADTIGQSRAIEAIEFGLGISARGYNLFIAGTPGSGRETTILDYLRVFAPSRPTPD